MAGDREVRIRFTGEGGVLKGTAAELRTLFGNLQNDTDDLRTAGEKWADAYRQQSARIRQDMDDIQSTAMVLADSLGPEMVAALEAQGRSVEQQVQELRKMGLSYDDIKVDSEQLAAALRDRDDALRQSTGAVGDGFRRVSEEADKSRSVVANFAGNAIQEIPGVTDTFGPLNMAIGQFAEYASEGDINLSSFLKGFGGIAVATAAVALLTKAIESHNEEQKRMEAQTEAVAAALEDQVGKTWELAAANAAASGELDGLTIASQALGSSLMLAGDNGEKLTEAIGALNLTTDEALPLVAGLKTGAYDMVRALVEQTGAFKGNEGQVAASISAMEDLGTIYRDIEQKTGPLTDEQKALIKALEDIQDVAQETDLQDITKSYLDNAVASNDATRSLILQAEANIGLSRSVDGLAVYNEFNRLLAESDAQTRDAVLGTHEYQDALRATQDALNAQEEAQRKATEAVQAAEQAERDLMDAKLAAIDTTFRVADAQDRYTEALATLAEAQDDPKTAVNEYDQAMRDAEQSALALAQANLDQAEAQAAANGTTLDAKQSNQILIDSLSWLAGTLAPDSPLRAALEAYIDTLRNDVPADVNTNVTTTGTQQSIDDIVDVRREATSTDGTTTTVKVDTEGVDDTVDRMGFVRQTAEDDAGTAEDAFGDLKTAIEDVPTGITIAVNIPGYDTAMSQLDRLRRRLREVEDAAQDAERAVAQVAD